jgi:hypothetical protein
MHSSHFPSRLEPTHQTRIRWSPTHFTTDFPSKPEPGARANAAMPRLITVMIMWCHFLWWWYQFVRRQFLWRQFLGCVIILAIDQKLLERLELCLVVWLTVVLHRILQGRMDMAASAGGRFGAHGCATGVGHTARAPRRGWVAGRRLAAAQLKGSICSQLHARPAAWSTSPPLSLWPKPSAQALPSPPARPDR